MSTLDEVGAYLVSIGVATLPDPAHGVVGNLFLGSRPDSPDRLISLQTFPGGPPEYLQNSFLPSAERVQLQVVTRDVRYEDADSLANLIWQRLAVVTNATLSGVWYRHIRPNHSPAILARDTNDRTLIYFNVRIEKEVTVVA